MKTTDAGDLGKGLIIADLLKRGVKIALPLGDGERYDLIADYDGRLHKVQCKATRSKNGALIVKCRSTSSWNQKTRKIFKYTEACVDWIAVADLVSGKVYYISAKELGNGKSEIKLRIEATKNQSKSTRLAIDYEQFYSSPL